MDDVIVANFQACDQLFLSIYHVTSFDKVFQEKTILKNNLYLYFHTDVKNKIRSKIQGMPVKTMKSFNTVKVIAFEAEIKKDLDIYHEDFIARAY